MSNFRLVKLTDPIQFTTIDGGLVPRGAYDNLTDYAIGDSVDYNGSSYVMFADAAAGTLPTDTDYWQVLAEKGDPLTVNAGTNIDIDIINPTEITVNTVDNPTFTGVHLDTTTPMTTTTAGDIAWNDQDGTVDIKLKGDDVTLQVGQEQVVRIVNKTGGNLDQDDYQVVRARTLSEGGAQGQRLAVKLAQADTKANHTDIIGVVTEDINNNQEGFVTSSGLVRNINTTGTLQSETWADGDVLYLSPTVAGGLTNVEPTAHPVKIGFVVYAHANNGKILVKIAESLDELGELHDVDGAAPDATGDLLTYNTSNSKWERNAYNITDYELLANKDTTTTLGTSDTKYPSQKAVKTYVDTQDATKVTANTAITGATKTKITYDSKGLVTAGADATTADIADSTDKRYITDAQQTVLTNTSGTNTGDVTVTDSSEIDFTLTGQDITASIKAGSIDETKLDTSVNDSLDLADTAIQTEIDPVFTASEAFNIDATDITNLGNLSGTNTGDETQSTIKTKLGAATTSVDGYLTSTDWNTFNGKQNALGFTPEDVANKSTNTSLGSSDTLYPSQNAVKTYVDTQDATKVSKSGDNMSGNLIIDNTATDGIVFYNTADQVTNFERVRMRWSGNTFTIGSLAGGTGTARFINIGNADALFTVKPSQDGTGVFQFARNLSTSNSKTLAITGTISNSSGIIYGVNLTPTYNQSGTAGYTALLINPTETATGSGAKNLIDAQVGGSSKFSVDNNGNIRAAALLNTASFNNSRILMQSIGTQIDRNIADANSTLIVDNKNASSTGDILQLKNSGGTVVSVSQSGLVGIGTSAPTHSLTLNSTATGITLYNTADQTTNFERVVHYWLSNTYTISSQIGGTGAHRNLFINMGAAWFTIAQNAINIHHFQRTGNDTATDRNIVRVNGISTASSGLHKGILIEQTINQSGTAGYTALLINPTETATGSGAKRLISAQIGGTDRFYVDNVGVVNVASSILPITNNGSALGSVNFRFSTINTSAMNLYRITDNNFSNGLQIYKRGTTGDDTAAVANGAEIGYHVFNAWDGSAYKRLAYVIVTARGATSSSAGGGNYIINTRSNTGNTEANRLTVNELGLTIADAHDIILNTTTGTKIATATTQKLSFWNATPIVQPTTAVAEAAFVANAGGTTVTDDSTFGGYTIQQVVQALRNAGLLA